MIIIHTLINFIFCADVTQMGNYSFVPGKVSSPILSMSKNYVTKEMFNDVLDKVKNIVRGIKLCF